MLYLRVKKIIFFILLSSSALVIFSETQAEEKIHLSVDATPIEIYQALTGGTVRSVEITGQSNSSNSNLESSKRIVELSLPFPNTVNLTEQYWKFIDATGSIFELQYDFYDAKRLVIFVYTEISTSEHLAKKIKQHLIKKFKFSDNLIYAKGLGEKPAYSPGFSGNHRIQFNIE